MARLDPRESQEALKERVTKAIHQSFPIKGSAQTLRVTGVEVTDEPDTHDVRTQKEKKLAGRTFGSVVKASFELVDNKTGKVVDTSTRRVATLPQITRRYSYIVNGTEYQTDNLWTLRPGVYSRVKQNGELESQINIRGGSYHLDFDPGKRKFKMRIGGSNPPLYSVMQALGVGDKALEKKWGREIFAANKVDQKKVEQDIIRLAGKINPRAKATTFEDASQVIRDRFEGAELDPEVTKKTLGKPIKTLGPVAMMETSSNLLKVSRGEREPDNRESLQFKQLQGVEDFISNRIKEQKPIIERRVLNNLDRKGKIKDIVGTDYFNRPINQFFAKSSLANQADDTNPVAMVGGQQKTTVVGTEGGIQSEHKLTEEVKLVDPSHLGFLDPLHTPEGPKTGVTLHTALGMRKEKGSITIPLYNTKTGKVERVDPATAQEKVVVMADEVTWGKDGKPTPKRDQLKASLKEGKMGLTSMKKADYVMPSAAQMFSLPLNMVPFLGNNSQNRVTMSGRHQEQAVSLKYREAPLVQSVQGGKSFDDVMGSFTAQTAPLAGEVVGVEKDSIKIKGADGKVKDVPIYDNYPLNEKKGVLNSEPQVKVGDTVKEGQLIADTNFSKGGTYAPGVNLRVAYLPAKGHNVEDGIVISESAARQLTSEHLYKKGFHKAEGELKGKKSYVANFPQRMTVKQQEKLGDDGVIKVGQRVEPGDTLIAGMTKRVVRKGEMDLGRIHKSLLRTYDDKGQVWDQDFPGEVVEVTKSRDGVKVHVKTEEPAQVGDKIVSRHANKGIVTCHNDSTFCLTAAGWKLFKDVTHEDLICTLNPDTHDIEYYRPSRVIAEPYRGKMYDLRGRRVRLCTTPNHRHYVRNAHKGSKFGFETSEELFGKQRVHIRAGRWEGEAQDTVEVGELKFDTNDFLRFFGFWIADGSISKKQRGRVLLAQTESLTPEIYNEMRSSIKALFPHIAVKEYETYMEFKHKPLWDWLLQFGTAREKFIPRWMMELSRVQLEILVEQLFKTDGMEYLDKRHNHRRFELYTSSPQLADDYQELALKVGMSANIRHPKKDAFEEHVVRFSLIEEAYVYNDKRRPQREHWIDYDGMVYCVDVPNHIVYVRLEGTPVWSGNSIRPDSEMPQTKDGKPIQVLHNPLGVMGRMNVGQILETAAGKIAEKEGKPFKVQNFALDDARGEVKAALKKAELSDTENLIDPKTGKEIPNVMTGQQYTLKLHHQVDQKMTARSRASYDRNLAPRSGHPHGGQAMGQMELYSLLSHGAVHNIREMATYKADRGQHGDNDELWGALQAGELLPPPKPTFAFKKFEGMLKTVGVNVEKEGNSLNLLPLTDKQVLETSSGAIKDGGKSVKAGTLDPEKGGLFDPETTGGTEGKKWSHITLHEPMPNPLFEGAISSLTGVDRKEYQKVINGEKGVTADGKLVDADVEGAQYGPSAVGRLLKNVDIDKELEAERGRIGKLRGTPLNKANRRIKYLSALKKAKLSPTEAYMTKHVPVMPPVMRPMSVSGDGSIQFEDVNQFYKHISLTNQKLRTMHKGLPDEERAPLRRELYDEMKSLTGLGGTLNRDYPGILDVIAGANPKTGFYQRKLIKKRQDMTMRSTIVPEPSLSLDEVGIPRKAAMEMYKPFVVREIRNSFGLTPMQAKQEIQQNTAIANKALERAAEQRPVLLKRDPVLHKHGVQAFKPRLTEGKAIQIHPLVTSSYGADFDGDTMAAFVPMTNEAVEEAEKMKPSNILFSPASGKVAYTPIKEMQVGLYNLTEVGKQSNLKFSNQADLEKAVKQGKLDVTDVAQVGGKKTTLGRLQLHATLPKDMQDEKILSDFKYRFDKKEQGKTYQQMAELDPKSYARRVDRLKDLGNERAYFMGYTVGLDDLKVHRDVRDPVLKKARERTAGLNMEKEEDAKKLVSVYADALTEIETKVKGKAQKGLTNLDRTERSAGIKGNGYRQLTAAPVLYEDAQGRPVPSPVERSYSEGLSSADYWASVSGGRKGIIQKVQSVSEPGYLSKRLVNASMNQLVDSADCKTDAGIALSTDESDILGRHTQLDIKVGDGVIPAGTLLKPEHLSQMRKAKVPKVVVRSPMRCAHTNGVCQKCLGLSETGQLYDEGTNIGVLASQSLGERGTQLQMRQFHAGGVMAPAGQKKALDDFGRSNELLNLTQKLKGSAVLASTGGTVQSIKKDPAGGWNVMVAGRRHYVRANRKLNIKKGDRVKKGMPLTGGPVNPHELLPLTNVNTVQNYLADELNSIYSAEGVKRRHSEVVVRTMTNNARVVDPGDSIDVVRNDQVPLGTIQQINRGELKGKKPIKYEPMIKGVGQIPLDLQEDWLARLNHENLKSTVIEGAQRGWVSDLHGAHPVPGLAYGAEFGKGKKGPY